MTTPTGQISLNNVNVELGLSGTTTISMNQTNVRTLAGVPSGAISMQNLQGKSNRVSLSYTYSANTANASLNLSAIGGYISGKSDITVTINSGVYLYSTSTGGYGLNLSGGTTGDTVTIVNNGFIMGQGGAGGGNAGGPALNLGIGINPTITNTSGYILGGGGGGGTGSYNGFSPAGGGGGGAGGGQGGSVSGISGGAGGSIGSSGSNGTTINGIRGSGGGGGRVVLGTGGGSRTGDTAVGLGGGSGGGGGLGLDSGKFYQYWGLGGGGGGWGASGGNGMAGSNQTSATSGSGGSAGASGQNAFGVVNVQSAPSGGSGGKGVNLNGRSITWTGGSSSSGRVYGAIS